MKILLILTWLAIGAAGYFAYTYHQKALADQAAMTAQSMTDLHTANDSLLSQNKALTEQLEQTKSMLEVERKVSAALRLAQSIAPVAVTTPEPPSATNFPSTITTLSGKTYEGCRFDSADANGISFFHAKGVARIPYADLDPAFAASFGYKP